MVTIAGIVGKHIGGELFQPSKAEILRKLTTQAAAQINAQAPKKVDDITTLVRAEATMGSKLTTYYTLENYDSYAKNFSLDRVKLAATQNACNKKGSNGKSPLSLGVTYAYVYSRVDGSAIGRFEVSQQDCFRTK